ADLNGVTFGNNKFVVTSATAVLSSADGLTWTSTPAPEIPNWNTGTIFINGLFYAGAGTNSFVTSADGLTWTGHLIGFNYADINGLAAFQGSLYAIGDGGMIISAAFAPAIVQAPIAQSVS